MRKTYYIRLENNIIKTSKRKPREADCLVLEDVTSAGKLKMGVKKIIQVSETPEDLVDEFIIKWDENIYPSKIPNRHMRYFNINNLMDALKEASNYNCSLNEDYEVFGGVWTDTGFDFKIRLATICDNERRIWKLV